MLPRPQVTEVPPQRRPHIHARPRDLREAVAAKIRLLHDPDGHFLGT